MAAIVPISCNQRWRSRSRNASTDSDFLGMMPTSPSVVGELTIDLAEEVAHEGDNEDKRVERVESPPTSSCPASTRLRNRRGPSRALTTPKPWRDGVQVASRREAWSRPAI
ncbi:hypothetical protein PR003_g25889 [Phytophthora rubi]|uniref:Uncharacterized protein n=1 Tax=Phytophthora rubi TaxID=129364 RepID=A0A6A3HPC4_9STRA|nr:hypothetical protein PR002_g27238 [Phytophthora rubi]KAE8970545.1 hypothetical protein PR001_g27176 [Phytophthora rubi]KAE9288095.1 hypothetical protein PR003_g25889 [Phytophthora rubi]